MHVDSTSADKQLQWRELLLPNPTLAPDVRSRQNIWDEITLLKV